MKVKHQAIGRDKHRPVLNFRNVPNFCFEISNCINRKIFLLFQIILITFNVFVLKSINTAWTSRAVLDMSCKLIFVSENYVAEVTLKSLFYFCSLTFLVIMCNICRSQINRKIIVIEKF